MNSTRLSDSTIKEAIIAALARMLKKERGDGLLGRIEFKAYGE